jgi:cell wall-associated NlpC family hydrolase
LNSLFTRSTGAPRTRRRFTIAATLAAFSALAIAAAVAIASPGVTPQAVEVATSQPAVTDAESSVTVDSSVVASSADETIELASAKTTLSFAAKKVVKVAQRYKGSAYRYGGMSPNSGFDCSGFTKYVYSKFGISLPHSAAAQGKVGHRISKAKAKAGDLIITSGGSHVGIYVGKGKFIDAPKPGSRVSVRKIYTSNYYVVRVKNDTKKTSKA